MTDGQDDDGNVLNFGNVVEEPTRPRRKKLNPGIVEEVREAKRKDAIDEEWIGSRIRKLIEQFHAPLKCHIKELPQGTTTQGTGEIHRGVMTINESMIEDIDELIASQMGRGRYRLKFLFRGQYVGDGYVTVGDNYPRPGEREAAEKAKEARAGALSPEGLELMISRIIAARTPAASPVDPIAQQQAMANMIATLAAALKPAAPAAAPLGLLDLMGMFEKFKGLGLLGAAAAQPTQQDQFAQLRQFFGLLNEMGVNPMGGGGGDENKGIAQQFLDKVLGPGVVAFSAEAGKALGPKIPGLFTAKPQQQQLAAASSTQQQPTQQLPAKPAQAHAPSGSKEITPDAWRVMMKGGATARPIAPTAAEAEKK
jgi:hypothetical protein